MDQRIVYGANCVWWDNIQSVGKLPGGLPCCPHCSGVLFKMENEKKWFDEVDAYEKQGHPGYRSFIEWLRGKCFRTLKIAEDRYNQEIDKDNP